jgi:phospholipid/cholesterol/gamma-HCH transport system substrate-binding protein
MKRRDEVLVGIFTTVALIVGVIGAIWLAQGSIRQGYPLYSKFPWGANLKQGQPVLLVGVNVGYVDEVALKDDGTLITTFRINEEYHVPIGTTATIIPNGIFGDVAIALTPIAPNPRSFAPGDTVPVGPAAPGLASITARLDTITRSVKVIVDSAQAQITDSGGVREFRRTIALSNRVLAQLSDIVDVQSRELSATQASFRKALSSVDSASVDSALTELRGAATSFGTLADSLRQTNTRLQGVLRKVESGDGSAAKLLNDPGLYNDLRRLLTSSDSLLVEFRKNPRKFVNVRIF